jgi:hypothetical protein
MTLDLASILFEYRSEFVTVGDIRIGGEIQHVWRGSIGETEDALDYFVLEEGRLGA